MKSILITNATIINENSRKISDIYINNGRIEQISKNLSHVKELVILFLENVMRDKEISLNLSLISTFSNASKI